MSAKPTGLSSVPGILTAGIHAGIKQAPELDLALIFSTQDTTAAGVFTTNKCAAAPVDITRRHIRAGKVRAIICNSGNANACTGQRGLSDALAMAHATAEALDLSLSAVKSRKRRARLFLRDKLADYFYERPLKAAV